MEFKGKIHAVTEIKSGVSTSGNQWRNRTIVIDTGDQYNPYIACCVMKDELIDLDYPIGSEVIAKVNIGSKEFKGRWFTNISCWSIVFDNVDYLPETPPTPPETPTPTPPANKDGDLPF